MTVATFLLRQSKNQTGVFLTSWFPGINPVIKENSFNSINSDYIDMKLGPVTKLDKRNKTMSKMFDSGTMSENYHFSDLWPISSNGEAGL